MDWRDVGALLEVCKSGLKYCGRIKHRRLERCDRVKQLLSLLCPLQVSGREGDRARCSVSNPRSLGLSSLTPETVPAPNFSVK